MKMEHEKARELFTDYLDGELAGEEKAALEEHLAQCEECRSEWETFSRTVEEVSGLLSVAAPEDFAREVEQKIRRRSKGKFFSEERSYSLHFAVVSFILIILFIIAYLLLSSVTEIIVLEQGTDDAGPIGEETGGAER